MFDRFVRVFPPECGNQRFLNASAMKAFVELDLKVRLPEEIEGLWREVGWGYFGDRVLYVFGDGSKESPRDSFQDWNSKDFWPRIYPHPRDGGPVFFAETCFGDQLGFRWEGSGCVYLLFCVDTFEAFSIASSGKELFEEILVDRYALLDEARFDAVRSRLGPLEDGKHYAPIVSPLLGGSGESENFAFESPNVHFRTAIATFESNALTRPVSR